MLQLFEYSTEFNKFGIVGKPQPSGILQWKSFWKKEKQKLEKMKMKIVSFIVKYKQSSRHLPSQS